MDEVKNSLRCCSILLHRELGSPKIRLIFILMVVFSYYNYSPLCTISNYYKVPVTPWVYPFFLSFPIMLMVNSGLCLLLFSDVGETDGYSDLMIAHSGRRAYISGQLLCAVIMALLYASVLWMLSILFIIPAIGWDSDWGVLLHTLAESSGQMQAQTGVSLSIVISGELLAVFTPIQATLMCLLCVWLSAAFIGVLICFFRIFVSRAAGIFAAGIFICMTLFSTTLGTITIGRWLQFISPLTWASFMYLDWYYSGITPSPAYAFTIWILGILGMGVATVWKFVRLDLEQRGDI